MDKEAIDAMQELVNKYFERIDIEDLGFMENGRCLAYDTPYIELIVPEKMINEYMELKKKFGIIQNIWEATFLYERLKPKRKEYGNRERFSRVLDGLGEYTIVTVERMFNSERIRIYVTREPLTTDDDVECPESMGPEDVQEEEADAMEKPAAEKKEGAAEWPKNVIVADRIETKKKPDVLKVSPSEKKQVTEDPFVEVCNSGSGCQIMVQVPMLSSDEAAEVKFESGRLIFPSKYNAQTVNVPAGMRVVGHDYKNGLLILNMS